MRDTTAVDDWKIGFSKKGIPFYFSHRLGQSTWIRPDNFEFKEELPVTRVHLLESIYLVYTTSDRYFFYDKLTKKKYWKPPNSKIEQFISNDLGEERKMILFNGYLRTKEQEYLASKNQQSLDESKKFQSPKEEPKAVSVNKEERKFIMNSFFSTLPEFNPLMSWESIDVKLNEFLKTRQVCVQKKE